MTPNYNRVTEQLFALLDTSKVTHLRILNHEPSSSSEESARIRKKYSGLATTGAKALLQRLDVKDNRSQAIAMFVLPGDSLFDAKQARGHLGIKKSRFLTEHEVLETTGLSVGSIPPFGKVLFPRVDRLYIDDALLNHSLVGFNAAAHEHSVILKPSALVSLSHPDAIFGFSKARSSLFDEIVEGRNYPEQPY